MRQLRDGGCAIQFFADVLTWIGASPYNFILFIEFMLGSFLVLFHSVTQLWQLGTSLWRFLFGYLFPCLLAFGGTVLLLATYSPSVDPRAYLAIPIGATLVVGYALRPWKWT